MNPQVDRLCMVCEMHISAKGKLTDYHFYEAVMNSHARLTYTKVAAILDGDDELRTRYQGLVPHLEELHHLYQALLNARKQRGAHRFLKTIETKFSFSMPWDELIALTCCANDAHKIY